METNCISCNEQLVPTATFCHSCGSQQKCKSCKTTIIKNAKHCIECGISLTTEDSKSDKAVNTIKFNQTADSRSYEIAFTDNVGVGVVEVIRNIADNQPQFKLIDTKNNSSASNGNNAQIADVVIDELNDEDQKQTSSNKKNEDTVDIPHITDVENTLDCSEPHWILIYSSYNSNHGKITFNKDDIHKAYKDKRETASRMSNFATNWKSLFKLGLIKTIKDGEFKLTEKGTETISDLIHGKIKAKHSKATPSKKSSHKSKPEKEITGTKKTGRTPAKAVQTEEFDLYKGAKKLSLADFLKEKKVGDSTTDRILAIAYYITNCCKSSTFSEGNIEYAYKVLNLNKRPIHLYQTILNTKNKNLWYEKENAAGKWKLARPGEVHFEENFGTN